MKQQKIYVEWLTSNRPEKEDREFMRLLAMAKYVIVDGNVPQLLNVRFREETTAIYLLDRGFRLYAFGSAENIRLKWQYRFDALLHERIPTVVESTSKDGLELSGYHMDTVTVEKLPGACVTDVLFDDNFRMEALEKIEAIFPAAKNKKRIVYMPQPRRRQKSNAWLELLDLEYLEKTLKDEYVVLVDFRSNPALADSCKNVIDIDGFSRNVSKDQISLRSLLAAADIVIGDYRDTFFESVLLGKPVFSTAVDLDEIQSNSWNMMYDLAEIYPFPIVHSAEELVEKMTSIEEYDDRPLTEFKEKYLIGCDGEVSERLLERILGRERKK
jgi:hypothetical protein